MKTQGHIYIKINEYFTATIRNTEALENILKSEEKGNLEIIEISNVSKDFEAAVRKIVSEYGSTLKTVELYELDRNGIILNTMELDIRTFKNGTVRNETKFSDFTPSRTQKIKTDSKGEYITVAATIAKKWYYF
jgi:hypothetical protein